MKKLLIATFILFIVAVVSGAVLQKTDAQIDIEACQREYSARWSQCISDGNTCSDACGENQDCKLNCNLQRNACEEAAVDQQRRCAHVWPYDQSADQDLPVVDIDAQPTLPIIPTPTVSPPQTTTPPPTVTPKPVEQPPAQTTPSQKSGVDVGDDSDDPELLPAINVRGEIIVDGTFYTVALVDDAPTKIYFEKMVSAVTGPGPEVSITLKSESPTVVFTAGRDAGINSNAFIPDPYNFMLNTSNLAIVQPTMIFNDGAEDKFSIDVGKLMKSLEASDADTLKVDTNSFLQKKIPEIMEQNPPVKTAAFEISKTAAQPLVFLSPAEDLTGSIPLPPTYSWSETISAGTSFVTLPGSLVVLDASANVNESVTVGGPAVTSQTRDFDDRAMSRADAVFEVKKGKAIVVAGWSAEDTLLAAQDFISALENVEVRHHKTAYGMAIDPESGKKIIEIYDGEIELFDRKTGAALITLATEFGKGIKRVEIDKDGAIKRQIAIPQSEWPAFVASQQKNRSNAWVWVLIILVIGGISYFAYRKKGELMKIIKKEPKQPL